MCNPLLRLRSDHEAAGAMIIIRLSQRDMHVLAKCAVAKWLSTSQLQKLCFPTVTPDAVRKSLRRLSEAGYLISLRQDRMSEAFHGLGAAGKRLLESRGLHREVVRKLPEQIEHMQGINDIRMAVESEPDRVAYFFACWELPALGWSYPVIPDAVCELKLDGRKAFTFEYDRATEAISVLERKLRVYERGFSRLRIAAVVVVADKSERLESLAEAFRAPEIVILAAKLPDITAEGVYAPVFRDLARRGSQNLLSLTDVSQVDEED